MKKGRWEGSEGVLGSEKRKLEVDSIEGTHYTHV